MSANGENYALKNAFLKEIWPSRFPGFFPSSLQLSIGDFLLKQKFSLRHTLATWCHTVSKTFFSHSGNLNQTFVCLN